LDGDRKEARGWRTIESVERERESDGCCGNGRRSERKGRGFGTKIIMHSHWFFFFLFEWDFVNIITIFLFYLMNEYRLYYRLDR
jgi:hypothetical protein